MNAVLSVILLILLFGLSFFLFYLIPFKKKIFQIVFISIMGAFLVAMFFIPSSLIGDIHLPIINSSINEFAKNLLESSQSFRDISTVSPGLIDKILPYIDDIVKTCFAFIFVSFSLLITTLICFIVKLFHKKKEFRKLAWSTLGTLVMCVIIMVVPVFNVFTLVDTANNAVGKRGQKLYISYPELEKYSKIIDIVDDLGFLQTGTFVDDASEMIFSIYTKGSERELIQELSNVNPIISKVEKSGIPVIYTKDEHGNYTFDFSQTREGTFDFEVLKVLVKDANDSVIYGDVATGIANEVFAKLEVIFMQDFGKEGLDLKLTKEEFVAQASDLIDMLKLVVDADLVGYASMDRDSLLDGLLPALPGIIKNCGAAINAITGNVPLITTMAEYMGTKSVIEVALFVCARLYTALNAWLVDFRETSLHDTCERFLKLKGVLK